MFLHSGTNVYMATHFAMYQYLPISNESAIDAEMYSAAAIFVCRFREVRNVSRTYVQRDIA